MNRQMRRVQKKAEDKQWKERDQLRAERLVKRQNLVSRRRAPRAKAASTSARATLAKSKVGRWSGIFAVVSTLVIILQSVLPQTANDQNPILIFVVQVAYYILFGYFVYLWLERRNRPNALYWTIGAGVVLIAAINLSLLFVPTMNPDWRVAALAAPMVALGAYLARLVYSRAV
jgi:cation transport ATPase